MTAASLLLAGGAGLLASLLVAPIRAPKRLAMLLLLSAVALGLGLLLLHGLPAAAAQILGVAAEAISRPA